MKCGVIKYIDEVGEGGHYTTCAVTWGELKTTSFTVWIVRVEIEIVQRSAQKKGSRIALKGSRIVIVIKREKSALNSRAEDKEATSS